MKFIFRQKAHETPWLVEAPTIDDAFGIVVGDWEIYDVDLITDYETGEVLFSLQADIPEGTTQFPWMSTRMHRTNGDSDLFQVEVIEPVTFRPGYRYPDSSDYTPDGWRGTNVDWEQDHICYWWFDSREGGPREGSEYYN